MKRENRLLGMYVLLLLSLISFVLVTFSIEPFITLGTGLLLFCGGYGLRETFEGREKE